MESLPWKCKGACSTCSLVGSLHDPPPPASAPTESPSRAPRRRSPHPGAAMPPPPPGDASARGSVVMTVGTLPVAPSLSLRLPQPTPPHFPRSMPPPPSSFDLLANLPIPSASPASAFASTSLLRVGFPRLRLRLAPPCRYYDSTAVSCAVSTAVSCAVRGGGGGATADGEGWAAAGAGDARGGPGEDGQGPGHREDARLHALGDPHVQRCQHPEDPEQGPHARHRQPHGPGALEDATPRGLSHWHTAAQIHICMRTFLCTCVKVETPYPAIPMAFGEGAGDPQVAAAGGQVEAEMEVEEAERCLDLTSYLDLDLERCLDLTSNSHI